MAKKKSIFGIGVCVTSIKRGFVSNIKFSGIPIVKLIKKKFNLPVKINNDAICFNLAEAIICQKLSNPG